MPSFRYKIRNAAGDVSTGMLEAASEQAAGATLRTDGRFVVKLEQVAASARRGAERSSESGAPAKPGGSKVKREHVITFAHQLAIMVDTGVPLSEALHTVVEQADEDTGKAMFSQIAEHVQAGGEFSAALEEHARSFPTVMIALVRAGEFSGRMGAMLERASGYLTKEAATAKKIRGALTYPAVMLSFVVIITVALLVFVLPRFATIYNSKGAALPVPTQVLMTASDMVIGHWPLLLLALIGLGAGGYLGLRTGPGQRLIDWLKLHTPVLGSLFRKLYISRACRTMGTMINAGVPILDMVSIARQVTQNVYFRDMWDEIDQSLRRGGQLSEVMFNSPLIPGPVSRMISAGEKSGELGKVLEKIASYTEEEFEEQVKQTTQYIEPLMITVMGAIIGFVAIALLLPVFSISKVVAS